MRTQMTNHLIHKKTLKEENNYKTFMKGRHKKKKVKVALFKQIIKEIQKEIILLLIKLVIKHKVEKFYNKNN